MQLKMYYYPLVRARKVVNSCFQQTISYTLCNASHPFIELGFLCSTATHVLPNNNGNIMIPQIWTLSNPFFQKPVRGFSIRLA